VLVTAHDAFGYFGRANGLTVRGIQGLSTDSEASLRELNALIDLIVERKVPAVFIESSVPRKAVEALVEGCGARGHAVAIGGELLSDAIGPAGTEQGTHVGMVVHDAELIARALGGTVPARPGALAAWLDAAAGRAP
jgi:manganese/zinc/iron transport system substrate-binding protein